MDLSEPKRYNLKKNKLVYEMRFWFWHAILSCFHPTKHGEYEIRTPKYKVSELINIIAQDNSYDRFLINQSYWDSKFKIMMGFLEEHSKEYRNKQALLNFIFLIFIYLVMYNLRNYQVSNLASRCLFSFFFLLLLNKFLILDIHITLSSVLHSYTSSQQRTKVYSPHRELSQRRTTIKKLGSSP